MKFSISFEITKSNKKSQKAQKHVTAFSSLSGNSIDSIHDRLTTISENFIRELTVLRSIHHRLDRMEKSLTRYEKESKDSSDKTS